MRYGLLTAVVRLLARIVLGRRLVVEGLEHVPGTGGVLLVCNHVGTVDPPLTGALVPRPDVHYMAKSEHFNRRWKRFLFYGYHAFPVVRHTADRTALRHALDLLHDGHAVLVYPEGHRSPDRRMQRPHAGAGFIARHARAVIVPVAIWGSENVIPKGRTLPRRVDVRVRFGPAFRIEEVEPDGRKRSNQRVADLIMLRIADLLPEQYRGIFDGRTEYEAVSPPAA